MVSPGIKSRSVSADVLSMNINTAVVRKLVISLGVLCASLSSQYIYAQAKAANGEYIIKMKSTMPANATQSQKTEGNLVASKKGFQILAALGKTVRTMKVMSETAMLQIYSIDKNKIAYLKSHPDVEFVEPNYMLQSSPTEVGEMAVPPQGGDTYAQNYAATQVTNAWSVEKAYNNATPRTIVAVIDTGLDTNHGVFKDSNAIWVNQAELNGQSGVDDDGNGFVDDVNGYNFFAHTANVMDDNEHGSHVAGIVIGLGESITTNPIRETRIQIMPLKFLDQNGSGTTSDAITAITYAVNNGAKVINNSWGGSAYSRALHEVYTYAYNHNVVIVSAAGNSSQNIDAIPMYPAALDTPSNISVASTTDSDSLSSFSNYSSSGLVHVSAPGSSILSAVPAGGYTCSYPGCFKYMSGTSMAAPFVAGLAALVIREAPQLSAYQVKGIILANVDYKSGLYGKVQTSGRVNVLKSINSAISNIGTSPYYPTYSPEYKVDSRSVASDSGGGGGGGGCGMVQALAQSGGAGSGMMELFNICSIIFMMMVPVYIAMALRTKKPSYVRKHDRFALAKDIQIKMNDQVLSLVSNSVSVGGFSFSKNLSIDKGQKIKVKIADHVEEVDAEVVWNRENNCFGVKFSAITEALQREIEQWTAGMLPTS